MTFEDIRKQFSLNPNETFTIKNEPGSYTFRPQGVGEEVKLIHLETSKEAPANIAFHMMQTPADVQKVTLFTKMESLFADIILAVRPLETLSVRRDEDDYILSDETTLPCAFSTMKNGESFDLDYISDHTKESDYDRT